MESSGKILMGSDKYFKMQDMNLPPKVIEKQAKEMFYLKRNQGSEM